MEKWWKMMITMDKMPAKSCDFSYDLSKEKGQER